MFGPSTGLNTPTSPQMQPKYFNLKSLTKRFLCHASTCFRIKTEKFCGMAYNIWAVLQRGSIIKGVNTWPPFCCLDHCFWLSVTSHLNLCESEMLWQLGGWMGTTDQGPSRWPNGREKLRFGALPKDALSWTGRDGRRASSCADNRQHAPPPDPHVHWTHTNTTVWPPTLAPHDLGCGGDWN